MKLINRIKKAFGKDYTGCRGGNAMKFKKAKNLVHLDIVQDTTCDDGTIPPMIHILDQSQLILQMRRDAEALQAKYALENITVVVYDSNSNIEFMAGPEVKTLDIRSTPPTTHLDQHVYTNMEERMKSFKQALRKIKKMENTKP